MASDNAEVFAQLTALEPIFHRFEHLQGRSPKRADFEAMTSPDYFEIGASGRLYTREFVLQVLEERHRSPLAEPDDWGASDLRLLSVSADTWLLTYLLEQRLSNGLRISRRSTLWRRTSDGWLILFHQGTLV